MKKVHSTMMGRRVSVLLAAVLAGAIPVSNATAQPDANRQPPASVEMVEAVKMIRGLRDRQMFELADIFAKAQLEKLTLNSRETATIAIERIQNRDAQARLAAAEDRRLVWQSAMEIADDFVRQSPDHPRGILVELQAALSLISRGKLIQQEIEAEIAPRQNKDQAIEIFRAATKRLQGIEAKIERLRPAVRSSDDAAFLTDEQLSNLKINLRFQLASINLAKAQLYDDGEKLNRIDALNQVSLQLTDVVTQSNAELPIWWQAQAARLACFRLGAEWEKFDKLAADLKRRNTPDEFIASLLSERVLACIRNPDCSLDPELWTQFRLVKNPTAEFKLTSVKLALAMAAESDSTDETKKWQNLAVRLVDEIGQQYGSYWGRRAEIELIAGVGGVRSGTLADSDFQILIRQGESALRKENFQDALTAFDRALKFAIDRQDAENALAIVVKIARCLEARQDHLAASERLFAISDRFANSEYSAAVHLRGCWNLSQARMPENDMLIQRLRKQFETWPESEQANQARFWLAGVHYNELRWLTAIRTYLSIDLQSNFFAKAIRPIQQCIEQISSVRNSKRQQAINEISQLLASRFGFNEHTTELQWGVVHREMLLSWLEVNLFAGSVSITELRRQLDAAMADDESDSDWLDRASCWKVVLSAVVSTREMADTESLDSAIRQLPQDPVLLKICLMKTRQFVSESELTVIADHMIKICDRALLNAGSEQMFWRIEKALFEIAAGQSSDSIEQLAAKFPDSLRLQRALAQSLARSGNLSDALNQWRRIAAKVKSESDSWYEAKFQIANTLAALGRKKDAVQLIRYLEITVVSWQESNWHAEFNQLLRELDQ